MKDLLCKLFGILKYLFLIISFGLVLYGIMATYSRLEKSILEAVNVFIPFAFVLIMYIIVLIFGGSNTKGNLLYNFVSCFVYTIIIIICLRSMYDKNMVLFFRYQINFNPTFFADNLAAIEDMLYMIGGSSILFIICDLIDRRGKAKKLGDQKKNEA